MTKDPLIQTTAPQQHQPATPQQLYAGRGMINGDDVQIDDGAVICDCEDGSYWISAWVYVPADMAAVKGRKT